MRPPNASQGAFFYIGKKSSALFSFSAYFKKEKRRMNKIPSAQYKWLQQQSAQWEQQGIIDSTARTAILQQYPAPEEKESRRVGTLVLAALSSVLLGLTLLWIIAYNWSYFPVSCKLATPAAGLIVCYSIAFFNQIKFPQSPNGILISEWLFFLGAFLFGAEIWVLGKTFNDNSPIALGMMLWSAGVMSLAVSRKTSLMHLFTAVLLAYTLLIISQDTHHSWRSNFYDYTAANVFTFLLLAVGLIWSIVNKKNAAGNIYILVVIFGLFLQAQLWLYGFFILPGTCIGALALFIPLSISLWLNKTEEDAFKPWSMMSFTRSTGMILLGLSLIAPTFSSLLGDRLFMSGEYVILMAAIFVGVIMSFFVGLTWGRNPNRKKELVSWSVPIFVFASAVLLQIFYAIGCEVWELRFWSRFVYIALFFLYSIGLICRGLVYENNFQFGWGLTFFFLWVILRYDLCRYLFGPILGTAAIFFSGALLLAALAYLWFNKNRLSLRFTGIYADRIAETPKTEMIQTETVQTEVNKEEMR